MKKKINNQHKSRPVVVVTGRNYGNILTVARSFGQAGYDVEILRVYKSKKVLLNPLNHLKPDKHSVYVKNYYECFADHNATAIIKSHLIRIAKKSEQKKLLIAVDDHLVYAIDNHRNALSKYYFVSGISEEEGRINQFMDKNLQKKMAEDSGLPMPKGTVIKSKNGIFKIPDTVSYPCFVKSNVSMNGSKTKMRKCDSPDILQSFLKQQAESADFEMLVEDYLNIETEYAILGLSAGGKVIAPGVLKTVIEGHKERKGVIVLGEVVPLKKFESLITQCIQFINKIGYTGIFDIDIIETKEGELFFVELNFRPGASTYALIKSGVNLSKMYADYVFKGVEIKEVNAILTGRTFVSEKNLFEEYIRGDVTNKERKKIISEADIYFIEDEYDKNPNKHFSRLSNAMFMMKWVYKIKEIKHLKK